MAGRLSATHHWLKVASILGGSAVVLMALASHALKSIFPPDRMESLNTAVLIQMLHTISILAATSYLDKGYRVLVSLKCWLWGSILFSGSIYLMMAKTWIPALKYVWPITPIGGIVLMVGWLLLWLNHRK